jgi:chemotaxis protein histidine kinase CheA
MTDQLMRELREHFRESARPRLAAMREQLAALRRDAHDVQSLDALSRHFHALAGLGGTYGFPRVSELADEGENASMPLARKAQAPCANDVKRWEELVEQIARDIAMC